MTDVSTYPLEDGFETTLAQEWDGATGTVYVNGTPDFTFPSGVTTYIVVNPGKSTMQLAEVDSYDSATNTFNVTNVTLNKGAGSAYSQQTHAVGSVVRISDNFEFWSELVTAINTKVDGNVRGFPAYADATARDAAITTPVNGMMIYNTADGVLQQYISGGWADVDAGSTPNASETVAGKVEIATDAEITSGSGTGGTGAVLSVTPTQLKKSISLKNSISSTDETDEFVVNDAGEDKRITKANLRDDLAASTTVKGTVEKATDAEAKGGIDATRYLTSDQITVTVGSDIDDGEAVVFLAAANTERSENSTTYVEKKSITCDAAGTYLVSFEIKSVSSGNAIGRIYVDDVATGTERSTSSSSYVEYSEEITVTAGQEVQLFLKHSIGIPHAAFCRNFKIQFVPSFPFITSTVNTD